VRSRLFGDRLSICWWPAIGLAVSIQRADGYEREPWELLLWLPFCIVGIVIGRTAGADTHA